MCRFNNVELTEGIIKQTRKHFRDICFGCIEEVKSGKCTVNDSNTYFLQKKLDADNYMKGEYDHTFTFLQRAYFLQTEESIPLLPF